jgi:phosphoribosylglycinamide formyltransferase 1
VKESTVNKLAIFASGEGTNAEAIMDYFEEHPKVSVVLVLSNKTDAGVLQRAANKGIPNFSFDRDKFYQSGEVLRQIHEYGVTHMVLAGFLWLMPEKFISEFPHQIINIHPSLLPKYGGKGMYGRKVHEAVKSGNEMETGITIHEVNAKFDDGKIIFQKSCALKSEDSVEEIAAKVRALEHDHYPKVIEKWVLAIH